MSPIRCFIAIPLPQTLLDALREVVGELAGTLDGVRWVKSENLHLTLRFLGEVESERIPDVQRAIDLVAWGHPCLSIELDGIGAFPVPASARVIWVGLSGEILRLNALQHAIGQELEAFGLAPESRPFRPHLTLGRCKRPQAMPDLGRIAPAGSFKAERVNLIRSELRRSGAHYTDLHSSLLQDSGD